MGKDAENIMVAASVHGDAAVTLRTLHNFLLMAADTWDISGINWLDPKNVDGVNATFCVIFKVNINSVIAVTDIAYKRKPTIKKEKLERASEVKTDAKAKKESQKKEEEIRKEKTIKGVETCERLRDSLLLRLGS